MKKFKIIKNFLNKNEINLCRNYFIMKHMNNENKFDFEQTKSGETGIYADPLTESFLIEKMPIIEKESNSKLLPTYSFFRMYTMFSSLEKHTDRPSCEVSVTVMVGSSGEEWPIYMSGTPVNLNPGDAVIYFGCKTPHWRNEFLGDWHAQFFLHYVKKDGKNKEYYLDKRPHLGYLK